MLFLTQRDSVRTEGRRINFYTGISPSMFLISFQLLKMLIGSLVHVRLASFVKATLPLPLELLKTSDVHSALAAS
jgi:hypothetical protein